MLIIKDKNNQIRVKVLDWDTSTDVAAPRSELVRFQEAWEKAEIRFNKPQFNWTAEEYGIARRLLAKHGLDVLTSFLEPFWWYHAEPLSEGYNHPMRLLAASISKIEADL